jgi:hypothetical protein
MSVRVLLCDDQALVRVRCPGLPAEHVLSEGSWLGGA